MRKWICMAMLLCLCLFLPVTGARAAETPAEDISGSSLVTAYTGFQYLPGIFDGDTVQPMTFAADAYLTLEYEAGIGSLYLIFDVEYGAYSITDNATGESIVCGENGFLHEFVDMEDAFGEAPGSVTISFENGGGKLNELYAFTRGDVPGFVQKWELSGEGKTDLVLFSAHGDDEQLFFAGILPYYAGELDYQVQVVYLTNHRNRTTERCHEMLNGLWAVGVTTYPVFGEFGDYLTTSAEKTYSTYRYMGVSEEELLGFVVEQLRRFKPLVAVGHDLEGEYGHGMHMLYADLLCRAVEISGDSAQFPDSAEVYGLWDVPKTYLHLYPENEIVMDWDQPLESFGGMTAFEVSKYRGFPCHVTQYEDFAWYISYAESAADIQQYSPCNYGLYRSTVGVDAQKNDFFENLMSYTEQELQAEQEQTQPTEEETHMEETALTYATEVETFPMETKPQLQKEAITVRPWRFIAMGTALVLAVFLAIKNNLKKS